MSQPVKTYKFLYLIEDTLISIAPPHNNEVSNISVRLPKIFENQQHHMVISLCDRKFSYNNSADLFFNGLQAVVEIEGEDIRSAQSQALQALDMLLSNISYSHNAPIGEPKLRVGHETTAEEEKTEFIQYEYIPDLDKLFNQSLRQMVKTEFTEMVDTYFNTIAKGIETRAGNNEALNISRAIRWYRKGLVEHDHLDRFISYWTGLENLNGPLIKLLGKTLEERKCGKCGHAYKVPSNAGIRSLFKLHSEIGEEDFEFCSKLRLGVLHATGLIQEADRDSLNASEKCRKMLRKGIDLLLERNKDDVFADAIFKFSRPHYEFHGHYMVSPKEIENIPLLKPTIDFKTQYIDNKRAVDLKAKFDGQYPFQIENSFINTAMGINVESPRIVNREINSEDVENNRSKNGKIENPDGTTHDDGELPTQKGLSNGS